MQLQRLKEHRLGLGIQAQKLAEGAKERVSRFSCRGVDGVKISIGLRHPSNKSPRTPANLFRP